MWEPGTRKELFFLKDILFSNHGTQLLTYCLINLKLKRRNTRKGQLSSAFLKYEEHSHIKIQKRSASEIESPKPSAGYCITSSSVLLYSLTSLTCLMFLIVIILHNEPSVFVLSFSHSLKTWPFGSSRSLSDVLSGEYGDGWSNCSLKPECAPSSKLQLQLSMWLF